MRLLSPHLRASFATLLTFIPLASASNRCSCGYSITSNAPNTTSPTLYTQSLETDFLHLYTLKNNPCWQPQQYNVTAADARGPYGKYATTRDVVLNPLPTWDTWEGEGVLGGDPGLRIWVNDTVVDGMVPMGEMVSLRNDMLYGSYRISMKVTGVPGTCGAFFWYRNNSEEIDMEFLSSDLTSTSHPVFLVMQTPASAAAGYNAANTSTYQVAPLPFTPDTDFHEYRFDWSAHKVDFYADGQWLKDLNWTYPLEPGHLSINHWSNGNGGWSQGPPAQDAVLVVNYVKAYFNTSDDGKNEAFEEGCYLDKSPTPCLVDDTGGVQAAKGAGGGNMSTLFLNRGMCGEKVSAKGNASASLSVSGLGSVSSLLDTTTSVGMSMSTAAVRTTATTAPAVMMKTTTMTPTQLSTTERTPANTQTISVGAAGGLAQQRASATTLLWVWMGIMVLWYLA